MRKTPSPPEISLLARPSAGRDPVEALDRDGHSRHRAADRRFCAKPLDRQFLSPASLADIARQAGEIGFIVLGMALVSSSAASISRSARCSR
jgi:hypothetical protein